MGPRLASSRILILITVTLLFFVNVSKGRISRIEISATSQFSATPTQDDEHEHVTVTAGDLGRIRGLESTTIQTPIRKYVQFLGIPYGQPLQGDARFKPSVLREGPLSRDGEPAFNATSVGSECPQPRGGSEDCLFMNIATPNVTASAVRQLHPVIVFMHGAAFVEGNSNAYQGSRLLTRDVVLVSFNFRLGVYGFLCLHTENAPCNSGLHDAITALKWVQKYIGYFGGDRNRVTFAGQSSGSASVAHVLLSPLSKGMFHRAATISGVAMNEWATSVTSLEASVKLATLAGCHNPATVPDRTTIVTCMQRISMGNITTAQQLYQVLERREGRLGFDAVCPAVQPPTSPGPIFLPDTPLNILSRQEQMDVPLLIGATKQDGAFGLGLMYFFYMVANGDLQNNATFLRRDLIPTLMKGIGIVDPTGGVYESIAQTYLSDEARTSGNFTQMVPGLIDLSTVFFFKAGIYTTAQLHSRLNATYLYSFDFKGTQTQHNPALPFPGGVAHADDLIYLFPLRPNVEFNAKEKLTSDTLIDYWVNFATTGDPSKFADGTFMPTVWPQFDESTGEYLIINEALEVDNDYPSRWVGASDDLYGPQEESSAPRFSVSVGSSIFAMGMAKSLSFMR